MDNTLNEDSSLEPQSFASQSVRLKEERLRREEEKLREIEVKAQTEINEKRQELLARESQLKELDSRMVRDQTPGSGMGSRNIPFRKKKRIFGINV